MRSAFAPVLAPRTRRRGGVATLVVAAVFTLTACMSTQQEVAYGLVNGARADAGVSSLAADTVAQAKAQSWAEHLAARNTLQHSDLSAGMDDGWRRLAENIGAGSSIEEVQRQFMGSAIHRANVLDRRFTHLGVGVAQGHGRTFVVLVFVQR